jgi:hypothetical protein
VNGAMMITCTAWDLAGGDYNELIDTTHEIFTENGRTAYHSASATPSLRSVKLQRFNNTSEGFWIVSRYLKPDDIVKLVPIQKKNRH